MPVRDMCMMFHTRGTTLFVAFFQEQGYYIYVTPTSYLELLATYKDLLTMKCKEVDQVRNRYSVNHLSMLYQIIPLNVGICKKYC